MPDLTAVPVSQDMPEPERRDRLPPEQRALLDAALLAALSARSRTPAARMRIHVRALCEAARRDGVAVEQLVIRVKEAWWLRAEVREMPRVEASEALARVVTLCISEYFAEVDAPPHVTE